MQPYETIKILNWEDFEKKIGDITNTKDGRSYNSKLLFRGQPDQELKTTLERYTEKTMSIQDYQRAISYAKFRIEAFTGHEYVLPTKIVFDEGSLFLWTHKSFPDDTLKFMVYLRQHGFPSPLLDWSESPYVATFFACNNENGEDGVVYIYKEFAGSGKSGGGNQPWIEEVSFDRALHSRHFLQQSSYTMCFKKSDKSVNYHSHEDAVKLGAGKQDKLWKLIIPSDKKTEFLKKLRTMNITEYSLFGTEESLMSTLALELLRFDS